MDYCVSEADILPLQAQAFGYAETRARGEKSKRTLGLLQVKQDCVCLFWSENHRFVPAGGPASNESHRVRFLASRNESVSLAMLVDQRHDSASLVQGWVCEPPFSLQIFQPLPDFKPLDAKRNPVAPFR